MQSASICCSAHKILSPLSMILKTTRHWAQKFRIWSYTSYLHAVLHSETCELKWQLSVYFFLNTQYNTVVEKEQLIYKWGEWEVHTSHWFIAILIIHCVKVSSPLTLMVGNAPWFVLVSFSGNHFSIHCSLWCLIPPFPVLSLASSKVSIGKYAICVWEFLSGCFTPVENWGLKCCIVVWIDIVSSNPGWWCFWLYIALHNYFCFQSIWCQ